MTVSSSPCWKNGSPDATGSLFSILRLLLCRILLMASFVLPFPAIANDPEIRYSELVPSEDQYVINADITLELSSRLEEVLVHGIPLHFVAECVITRSRWYWWDEKIVERRLAFRISYQPLTQTYRLSVGSLGQNFTQLAEAVGAMKRLRNWGIIERARLTPGESYNVALRFRLDTNQLPKPFQVTAFGSREWDVTTNWSNWTFLASR